MPIDVSRDLRTKFGAIRDQGSRPTCVAFATSDAHAAARGPFQLLSVEHLYFHAIQRSSGSSPADGVSLLAILEALDLDGQCVENGWPYQDPFPNDISTWRPPATARPVFRHQSTEGSGSLMAVFAKLDAGQPVVVVFRMSERYFTPVNGFIVPDSSDVDVGYHAVIVVGYGQDRNKRFVLIRNSWGHGWGTGGYAWVPADNFEPRIVGYAVMTKRGTV